MLNRKEDRPVGDLSEHFSRHEFACKDGCGMKKSEILEAVEGIRVISNDAEAAHSQEDSLRELFIEYIATRKDSLGEKAKIILSTNEIEFERWCA